MGGPELGILDVEAPALLVEEEDNSEPVAVYFVTVEELGVIKLDKPVLVVEDEDFSELEVLKDVEALEMVSIKELETSILVVA